jgi:hypothetical protein
MRDSNAMVQHFNPACRAARMYPALPISRLLMSVNDRDIPLSPTYDWWGLTYVYFSAGLLALTFLPEVLQESVVELATGTLVNFALMAMAQFGSYSPLIASLTLVLFGLAVIYVVFDGNSYVRRFWQHVKPKTRVSPNAMLYDDDNSEHKSDGDYSVEDDVPALSESMRVESTRAGLFDKHHRVKLKEGQWRVIKHRVTQVRALRGLQEMNRKFKIETALDTEVTDYAHDLDSDSDEEGSRRKSPHKSPHKLEISPRRMAFNAFSAKSNSNLALSPDEENMADLPAADAPPQLPEDGEHTDGGSGKTTFENFAARDTVVAQIGRFIRSTFVSLDDSDSEQADENIEEASYSAHSQTGAA